MLNEKKPYWFWGIIIVYLLVGIILYFPLRYQINPDAICYLTIAKDYAHGHWSDAVNAYWSPLISWIIACFAWIPIDPLFIFKWYNLLVGAFGLAAVDRLMNYLQLKQITKFLFLSVLSIVLLRFAFMVTTPDLTVTVLLLFFITYWLEGKLLKQPVYTGLWLVLLYYAKAYNLFFAGVLIIFEVVQLLIRKELAVKRIVVNVALVAVVFFVLALPWLLALQQKYGYFMLAGTAKFNHGAARYDNYAYMMQFVVPANSHAIFAWEDPVLLSGFRDYSVFASKENMLFQLSIIWKNLRQLIIGETTVMLLVFIGTILLGVCWIFRKDFWKLLFFSCLYISGYILIFIEDRYIWTSMLLGFVAATWLFDFFLASRARPWIWISLFAVAEIFLARHSLYNNFFKAPPHYNSIAVQEYATARQFRSLPAAEKRMAKWPDNGGYPLFASWYAAYFAESQHYFSLPADPGAANALIAANRINIVFLDDDVTVPPGLVINSWKKIPTGISGTLIYQRP